MLSYTSHSKSLQRICSLLLYLGTLSLLLFPLLPRCLPCFPGSGDIWTIRIEEMWRIISSATCSLHLSQGSTILLVFPQATTAAPIFNVDSHYWCGFVLLLSYVNKHRAVLPVDKTTWCELTSSEFCLKVYKVKATWRWLFKRGSVKCWRNCGQVGLLSSGCFQTRS